LNFSVGLNHVHNLKSLIGSVNPKGLTLSVAVNNIGVEVQQLSTVEESLPMALKAGLSYNFMSIKNHQLDLYGGIEQVFSSKLYEKAGLEYTIMDMIYVRSGYLIGSDTRGLTVGAGAKLNIAGFRGGLDFSYVPIGDLKSIYQFGVTFAPAGEKGHIIEVDKALKKIEETKEKIEEEKESKEEDQGEEPAGDLDIEEF
jgi:hypothetical protein